LERYDRAAIEFWMEPALDKTSLSFGWKSSSFFSGDLAPKKAF